MEWRRIGRCEPCGHEGEIIFKPADFDVLPNGVWVCASCDPEEHEDYARGLVELGEEIGHRPS